MWVEHLDIRGYKRLSGEFDFDRRLSIVCGVNEAGKSTMHDAVVRSLFGFSRSERRGRDSEQAHCRPWNGNPYAIHATVNVDNGRLRIEWDLDEHEVTVHNLDTGEDLSAQMDGPRGDVLLGPYLMSLELDDFRQACCLDQGEISAVPHSEDLVVAMQHAVEAGTAESGVEAADGLLLAALNEDVGVRRDNLQPTPNGRLRRLIDQRDQLESQLAGAIEAHREIAELEQQARELENQQAENGNELVGVEQGLLRAREQELAARLKRAREHSQRASIEVTEGPEIPEEKQTEIITRVAESRRLEDELASARPQAEAAKRSVEELEGRRQTVQMEFDGLAGYEEADASAEAKVQGLIAQQEGLKEQAQEPTVAPPAGQPQDGSGSGRLWALAGAIASASVALGLVVTPAALVGIFGAAVVAYLAVQRRRPSDSEAAVRHRLAAERRQQAARDLEALDRQLSQALDSASASRAGEGEQRARAYLVACQRRHRWTELRAELGDVRGQLTVAREPLDEVARIERRIAELREELADHYREMSIDPQNLAAAWREFNQRIDRDRERSRQQVAAKEASEGLETALRGLTMEELEAAQSEAATRLGRHVAQHGELDLGISPDELSGREGEIRDQLTELSNAAVGLRTQIADREENLPDVPAVREALQRLDEEIRQLRDAARAIDVARSALKDAAREAHRAFRPHLKDALDRNLGRVTNGRYSRVEIDDALNLTLVEPETGRLVPATRLSKGTQDQIYFVERLEMIDLLDPTTGEAPLLLDEPFTHFDDARLAAALELLAEETHERQVMLFTCDDDLVEAACRVCDDPTVIRLPEPTDGLS